MPKRVQIDYFELAEAKYVVAIVGEPKGGRNGLITGGIHASMNPLRPKGMVIKGHGWPEKEKPSCVSSTLYAIPSVAYDLSGITAC